MFISTLVQTLFKVVVLAVAALIGIITGKKLRDRKKANSENKA